MLDDRTLDLVEGGFDVALRIGALQDSSLVAQRLGTSRSALVAHPGYLAHAGAPRTPKDLEGHATLAYSLSQTLWTLKQGRRSEVLRVKPLLRANSSVALLGALRQRLGIARMPLFVVGQELARGRLARVLPGWELPASPIHAVTTARSHLPRKTRAFIDFFRARLGEPPPWE